MSASAGTVCGRGGRILDAVRARLHGWYRRLEVRDHELLYVFLEITRRCNLACLHCGSDCTAQASADELSLDEWIGVVERVHARFGTAPVFVITGGEPLLSAHLPRLAAEIARRNMRWGMVTNGLALSQDRLRGLLSAGLSSITISLDGSEASHDWLRGCPGAHARALAAIRGAASCGVRQMDVVTCVNPRNIGELDDIARDLVDAGVPAWRLFRIFPSGRAAGNADLLLDREQAWRMIRWLEASRPALRRRGLRVDLSCEGWLPMHTDRRVRSAPFFCRAGVNIASVLCDGTITGCSNNDPSFSQGSIRTHDLAEVWKSGFEDFRGRPWLAGTSCARCPDIGECCGGSMHLWRKGDGAPRFCYMR